MEHARRIAGSWSWLPAFRAVAETEHLPTASRALHVTASALSRTIRLLEDEVGQPLFDRVGRRLALNAAGRELLGSVRTAMREVHEAYVHLEGKALVGSVTIATPGPFASLYVVPALGALHDEYPELLPEICASTGSAAQEALRRGDIDVAILDDPHAATELETTPLRVLAHDVFCGPDREPGPSTEWRFVAPAPNALGQNLDRWPDTRARVVGLRVDRMATAIGAVHEGPWVAVLPVDVGRAAGLRQLSVKGLPRTELSLLHRPTLSRASRTEAVVEAITQHILAMPK